MNACVHACVTVSQPLDYVVDHVVTARTTTCALHLYTQQLHTPLPYEHIMQLVFRCISQQSLSR